MYYFTADQHFLHKNVIKYCDRPFKDVEEMDKEIIKRHNEVVNDDDTVIHAGDFTLANTEIAVKYIKRLKGNHIFLMGSHDRWLKNGKYVWKKTIEGQFIFVCHYAFRVWERSHYNSWNLFGHSHSSLEPQGKQWDIGVDNNNFYPVSFVDLKNIMKNRPDNFNKVTKAKEGIK